MFAVQTPDGYLLWAGSNLSASKTFATTLSAYGYYFTWSAARSACPTGWRLPTSQELGWLNDKYDTSVTRTYSSAGLAVAKSGLYIVLPLAGYRNIASGTGSTADSAAGSFGYYWSSVNTGSNAYSLHIAGTGARVDTSEQANGFSVRCVRDCYRGYVN